MPISEIYIFSFYAVFTDKFITIVLFFLYYYILVCFPLAHTAALTLLNKTLLINRIIIFFPYSFTQDKLLGYSLCIFGIFMLPLINRNTVFMCRIQSNKHVAVIEAC